jgi:hypothetical protein
VRCAQAITAFLSTFNTTVLTLMTYPNLLMWCARVAHHRRRATMHRRAHAVAPHRTDAPVAAVPGPSATRSRWA